jgi:8-oxo-dGTP diphosphatase
VIRRVLVVAAVIGRGDAILVTRRKDDAERGGQWEFPGGKVEPGEDEPSALVREIDEELGCAVEVGDLLARNVHRYPDLEVELAFYACRLPAGAEPRALGVAAMEWAERSALSGYDFCEADLPVLPLIARR